MGRGAPAGGRGEDRAAQGDAAGIGAEQPGDTAADGGLAGAGGTDERPAATGFEVEVDPVGCDEPPVTVAVGDTQSTYLENRDGRGGGEPAALVDRVVTDARRCGSGTTSSRWRVYG